MGDNARAGKAVGTGSLIALAMGILATRDKAQAAPNGTPTGKEVSLDEAAMALLLAIAQSGEDATELLSVLNQIVASISPGVSPGGVAGIRNLPEITAFRVIPTAANTAFRLPDRTIPDGMELVIKSEHDNAGIIYVANTQAEATNPNSAYTLIANEAVEYKVSTPQHIWISATVLGEGVVCTVEQAAGGG